MRKCAGSLTIAGLLVLFALPLGASTGMRVSTVAGSGGAGVKDGSVSSATFVMPFGIAVAPNGDIFVSDTGAQRIRRIRNGVVTTIAGTGTPVEGGLWVEGGFAQKPARFNQPVGIVAGRGGDLYVADSMNHVIRKIDSAGNVSIYAGSPVLAGHNDGPRLAATFERPFALAIDRAGNLYVGDMGVGVRRIFSDGTVITLPIPITEPTGIAVSPGSNGAVFIASPKGIYVMRYPPLVDSPWTPNPATVNWLPNTDNRSATDLKTVGDIGHPLMIAALNDSIVIYTDAVSGSVRRYNNYYEEVTVLTGDAGDDVRNDIAGYRDGPISSALLTQPAGVAVDRDGGVLIADAGNRRIRKLSKFSLRTAVYAEGTAVAPPRDPKTEYRISHVGNSFVFNADWETSIQRPLETGLNASRLVPNKTISVVPFRVITREYWNDLTYIDSVIDPNNTDAVLLQFNALQFDGYPYNMAPDWAAFKARLARTSQRLARLKIPLIVVVEPLPDEFAPSEYIEHFITRGWHDAFPMSSVRKQIEQACRELRIPYIGMFPAFIAEENRPNHRPLYGTFDPHINAAGRAFEAKVLEAALETPALKRYLNSSGAAAESSDR